MSTDGYASNAMVAPDCGPASAAPTTTGVALGEMCEDLLVLLVDQPGVGLVDDVPVVERPWGLGELLRGGFMEAVQAGWPGWAEEIRVKNFLT